MKKPKKKNKVNRHRRNVKLLKNYKKNSVHCSQFSIEPGVNFQIMVQRNTSRSFMIQYCLITSFSIPIFVH